MEKYQLSVKKAEELISSGKYHEAIKIYESLLNNNIQLDDLISLAGLYIEVDLLTKAGEIFDFVLERYPNHAVAIYGKGLICEKMALNEEAIVLYKKALIADSSLSDVRFNIAYLLETLGKIDEAIYYYLEAIKYDDQDAWSYLNLGSIYEKQNKNEEALGLFLKALKIDSNIKMANYNVGVTLVKLGRFEEAFKYYQNEIELVNGFPMAYLNISLLYKDLYKDYDKSKKYYLQAIKKYPDEAVFWYNLGCLYAITNDYKNAYDCLFYSLIKDRKLYNYMLTDKELDNFKTKKEYGELLQAINKK